MNTPKDEVFLMGVIPDLDGGRPYYGRYKSGVLQWNLMGERSIDDEHAWRDAGPEITEAWETGKEITWTKEESL